MKPTTLEAKSILESEVARPTTIQRVLGNYTGGYSFSVCKLRDEDEYAFRLRVEGSDISKFPNVIEVVNDQIRYEVRVIVVGGFVTPTAD